MTEEPGRPLLSVVRGDPAPEELAALVAVVSGSGSVTRAEPPDGRSAWSRGAGLRRPLEHRPGAWRMSAWR